MGQRLTLTDMNSNSTTGQKLRTEWLQNGSCAFTEVDGQSDQSGLSGQSLIMLSCIFDYKKVLETCLLHICHRAQWHEHQAMEQPVLQPCCNRRASTVRPWWIQHISDCIYFGHPSQIGIWCEYDILYHILPLPADPKWAEIIHQWGRNEIALDTESQVGWNVAFERVRIQHFAVPWLSLFQVKKITQAVLPVLTLVAASNAREILQDI